ncbi:MAG: FAD-binding oxidoreductase [Geminicoccaceae bacterium]
MGPKLDPVPLDPTPPTHADVVIIGGGIIGTCTALHLAQRGVSVALCEKGDIAGEQSSRNWGWVRKQGRDPRELPLAIEALRQWQGMSQLVQAETGFRTTGIMYGIETDADMARQEAWLRHAQLYQLDSRIIGRDEFDRLMPGAAGKFKGALFTASDGRAEPQKAAPAIALAARRLGAKVLTNCAVRTIEQEGGKVAGVVTEKGRIRTSSVVLAGGAWSSLFMGNLGIRLPQLTVINSVMRTAPLAGAPESALWMTGYAFRKRLDGGYTIANGAANLHELSPDSFRFLKDFLPALQIEWRSHQLRVGRRFLQESGFKKRWTGEDHTVFEEIRINDPAPERGSITRALRDLSRDFPAFARAQVVQEWAGRIDVTPDIVPVISPVDTVPGFFVATGFSGHGFGIGPGAGRLVADLVMGRDPVVDATPFRLSRFLDGTRAEPMGHV